ncbi:MAG: aspartate dehydrogenase [Candidatus Omnitrophota bacterium]
MAKLKIGIVGCGAIGSSLATYITRNLKLSAELSGLYDLDNLKSESLAKKIGRKKVASKSLKSLVCASNLVIESASAESSFSIASVALKARKDILIMSVGGIAHKIHLLRKIAYRNNCKVYLPSGALSGVDALKASNISRVRSVTLVTTKNPLSFKGVKYIEDRKIKLLNLKKKRILFCGRALDAVKYFPQNINVAAILSLSGLGLRKTRVKIIASPKVKKNIHEVWVRSDAGNFYTRTENIPHPDNPKTSYLAVLSAIAVLKGILEPVSSGTN